MNATATASSTGEHTQAHLGSKWWLYLAALVFGCAIPACALLQLARSLWFWNHSTHPQLTIVGYGQSLKGANCQILVYGDSSALTGLDPQILERETGLSACSIAEGTTIQEVIGSDAPLQDYLAHNAAPRVLLTSWTPTLFLPSRAPREIYTVEGMTYALRYGTGLNPTRTSLRWTWEYLSWVWSTAVESVEAWASHKLVRPSDFRAVRVVRKGQFPYPLPPETHCTKNYGTVRVLAHPDSVAAFRRRYTTPQTAVLVDMTPVPNCDPLYDQYLSREKGTYDNVLQRYPIDHFNEGDVHLSPKGADRMSREAAAQVLALLHRESSAHDTSIPEQRITAMIGRVGLFPTRFSDQAVTSRARMYSTTASLKPSTCCHPSP